VTTPAVRTSATFPAMPLAQWIDTKETLHRWLQIIGKIRLAAAPPRNHWWHVPFHLTGRGITTRPMGTDPVFTIDVDLVGHRLLVHTITGRSASFSLPGHSVASFHDRILRALGDLGVPVVIDKPEPYDLTDATPFAEDTAHASYDPVWATRYWQVLSQVNLLLEEFAGGYSGKTSPVHHFWHTFDIAVTRFSDRVVRLPATVDAVTREAYSREVISVGFWFGDASFPEPAFYAYTAPEPMGLASEPLQPPEAHWLARDTGHVALYRYDDARGTADPRTSVLAFYDSAYRAGATRAGWDIARFDAPGGSTAPPVGPGTVM